MGRTQVMPEQVEAGFSAPLEPIPSVLRAAGHRGLFENNPRFLDLQKH